ncbi:MAG: hypothetical protein IH957_06325 [Chloroflexi bacterium]|nr:hypothetical protein [Chloroflexota bacterium]
MRRDDRHVRGWVRSFKATPAPGTEGELNVELRLNDQRNVERYIRWRAAHYAGRDRVDSLDLNIGDEAEVLLDVDSKGRYTKNSFLQNHTRRVRYTLTPIRRRWWPFGR